MTITPNQGLIVPDPTDVNDVPASVTELLSGGVTPSAGLENRLVQRYGSATDRTGRNGTPNEGELSYLTDTNLLQFYNGAAWVTITSDQHQAQELLISFAAATSFSQAVVFPVAFASAPNVHVNINSAAGATAQWGSRAFNVTNAGFTLFFFTPGAATAWANIPVQWSAFVRT